MTHAAMQTNEWVWQRIRLPFAKEFGICHIAGACMRLFYVCIPGFFLA